MQKHENFLYETVRTSERSNRVIREEYFDLDGNPTTDEYGHHAKMIEYERHDYVSRETYLDLDGEMEKKESRRRSGCMTLMAC